MYALLMIQVESIKQYANCVTSFKILLTFLNNTSLLVIYFFYKNDKNDKADNPSQLEVRIEVF